MAIKVAHIAVVAPHRAGLYESARELVAAQRAVGIDARVVDPSPSEEEFPRFIEDAKQRGEENVVKAFLKPPPKDWQETREPKPAPLEFALQADILVSHSGLVRQSLIKAGKPVVEVIHGRPRVCFLYEHLGEQTIYTYYRQIANDPMRRAFVHFWPEYQPYWQMIFPEHRLRVINPSVDLDFWTPGPKEYDFQGQGGQINVVCTDRTRNDKDIYHQLHAFAIFAQRHPQARLHVCGLEGNRRGFTVLLDVLRERGVLGQVLPTVIGLEHIYRAADLVVTPHKIAVRTVCEALACGCQLVAPSGNRFTPYTADEEDPCAFADAMERAWQDCLQDRAARVQANRATAVREFNPATAAVSWRKLFEEILAGGPAAG